MMLEQYKQPEGYSYDNCWYEDAETLIQCGVLEFCGCGDPEGNLDYIRAGLRLIDEKGPDVGYTAWYKDYTARVLQHFGNKHAADFFFYWADKEKLTEHGGCIPGWLTDKGKNLLALLEEWNKERESS